MSTHGDGAVACKAVCQERDRGGEAGAGAGGAGLAWPLQRKGGKGSKEVQTECECA